MRRLSGVIKLLWRPVLSALVLQGAVLFLSVLFPSADGASGAPFAAGYEPQSFCQGILPGEARLDIVPLFADVLVTAAILAALGQGARGWSLWVPLAFALVVIWLTLSYLASQPSGATVSPYVSAGLCGVAFSLWVAGLAGYAAAALLLWPIRRGWRPPIPKIG